MQKMVWITGASSGIGRALAIEFAENKKNLILSSKREKELQSLGILLSQKNIEVVSLPLNVQKAEEVERAASGIGKSYEISCLINNAGVTSFNSFEDTSLEEINDIITTNLLGSIYTIKSVLPFMIENKKGTIINIISAAAEKVFTNSSIYSASKAGLLAFANVLREEVRKYNIRVINILPGATKTPIWNNEVLEKYGERMMSPQQLAKLIVDIYSYPANFVAEEIIVKPIKGDL